MRAPTAPANCTPTIGNTGSGKNFLILASSSKVGSSSVNRFTTLPLSKPIRFDGSRIGKPSLILFSGSLSRVAGDLRKSSGLNLVAGLAGASALTALATSAAVPGCRKGPRFRIEYRSAHVQQFSIAEVWDTLQNLVEVRNRLNE